MMFVGYSTNNLHLILIWQKSRPLLEILVSDWLEFQKLPFETKVITCNLSTGMLTIGFMNDDNKLLNNPLILSCTWKKKKKFLSLKYNL
jgi:hypothetical protein